MDNYHYTKIYFMVVGRQKDLLIVLFSHHIKGNTRAVVLGIRCKDKSLVASLYSSVGTFLQYCVPWSLTGVVSNLVAGI